jgi:hypothetical protein
MGISHLTGLNLKIAFLDGGAAGAHTLTGIATDDNLLYVGHLTTSVDATFGFGIDSFADLTSEFSISAADTIDNTGGTATTNDHLVVLWLDRDE